MTTVHDRAAALVNFIFEWAARHDIDVTKAWPAYCEARNQVAPIVVRSAQEVLDESWESILDRIRGLPDNDDVPNLEELMRDSGLDPAIKSDKDRTRNMVKKSGLIEVLPGSPQKWVRRITHANGHA